MSERHAASALDAVNTSRSIDFDMSNNSVGYEAWYVTKIGEESRLGVSWLFKRG